MTTAPDHHATGRPAGLAPEDLRRVCGDDELPAGVETQAARHAPTFGQERAFEALEFAASMPADGYNVFATGPSGTGRRTMIRDWLRERAASLPAAPDIVYVHNFGDPLAPHAIALPPRRAGALVEDVARLVDDARHAIAQAFESDTYRTRHRAIHDEIDNRRKQVLRALDEQAQALGIAMQLTPGGVIAAPISGGRPLQPDEIQSMPDAVRERYEQAMSELEEPVDAAFETMRGLDRELRERHRELNREVAVFAIGHLVDTVKRRWADAPRIPPWFDALREDAIENLDVFRAGIDEEQPGPTVAGPSLPPAAIAAAFLQRYAVNVLTTHDPDRGAPIVVATDASFSDLFGRVEYETAFGQAITDHRHLRAGLVHQAAGGFLILQAADVLSKPYVWPRLKDVLRTGSLKIENVAVQYMLFPGVTLNPEPVEIRMTVVLVGSTHIYRLLLELDDDLTRLFKLRADFDDEMPRDADGVRAYAGLLARLADRHGLLTAQRDGIGALVEHGSRMAGHRERLSTRVRELADIATQASRLAAGAGAPAIGAEHVAAALRARRRRADLVEQRILQSTLEETIHIDVAGSVVGQVNGLAVALLGDHEFGHPVRITATVAPGEGEVLDIDREARLSGPVHAKGVLILSGYLAGHYFLDRPMALRASIVFEQSYGPVEGDSASTAELLALLSALGRLPVDQGIAVTGAIDQHGAVHAIGGVNEKIEGFFDLCAARGLTGRQGVIVPHANLPHLMLDERVVAAVREDRFRIWPVRTVDEALTLITGTEAASEHVRERLAELAKAARAARAPLPRGEGSRAR